VIWRDSFAKVICRYPCERCTSVKISYPSILCRMSSTVGIWTRRRTSA
jgi:hypothetical protein